MVSLIWKFYSDPVTVVPSKWIAPVERLVAFPTGVAGNQTAAPTGTRSPSLRQERVLLPLTDCFFPPRWSRHHLLVGGLQQSGHAGSPRRGLG